MIYTLKVTYDMEINMEIMVEIVGQTTLRFSPENRVKITLHLLIRYIHDFHCESSL